MSSKSTLEIEDVRRAFREFLGREVEENSENYWIENVANYEALKEVLEESSEGIAYLDRAELARRRSALSVNETVSKISSIFEIFESKPQEKIDLDAKCCRILKAYADWTKPGLIVAAGGENAEDIACHVAALSGGIALSLSTGAHREGLIRVPMTVAELTELLDKAGVTIGLAIIDPKEALNDFAALYRRLPENGVAVCLGERGVRLDRIIRDQKAFIWGESIELNIGILVTRAIWPFPVSVPIPKIQIIEKKRKKIALATIARNEQAEISKMIKSCSALVDHVTILDTGSNDKTISTARKALEEMQVPYGIHCTAFVNFSQARNTAISFVPAEIDWLLMLDADEHLTPRDVQCLIDIAEDTDAVSVILPRYNLLDSSDHPALGRYPDRQARFFQVSNGNQPHYINAVHEALVVQGTSIFPPLNTAVYGGDYGGPHIHHRLFARTHAAMVKKAEVYNLLAKNQSGT